MIFLTQHIDCVMSSTTLFGNISAAKLCVATINTDITAFLYNQLACLGSGGMAIVLRQLVRSLGFKCMVLVRRRFVCAESTWITLFLSLASLMHARCTLFTVLIYWPRHNLVHTSETRAGCTPAFCSFPLWLLIPLSCQPRPGTIDIRQPATTSYTGTTNF